MPTSKQTTAALSSQDRLNISEVVRPDSHVRLPVSIWQAVNQHTAERTNNNLIEEIAIALVYNGISHAVMLATPNDLEDFAYGFSLSEGIVSCYQDIYGLDIVTVDNGIELQIELATERFSQLRHRRRTLAGRSGCGLCGIDSLTAAQRPLNAINHHSPLSRRALAYALDKLIQSQHLHHLTGGTHAAAWVSADGQLQLVREDVGRHNALDKLIGALLRRHSPTHTGFALITSRASYEMVHKAVTAGISCLAAVSAPTAYAVRLAESSALTLIGFARGQRCTVYTRPETITN